MKTRACTVCFAVVFCILLSLPSALFADPLDRLDRWLGPRDALVVTGRRGETVYSKNARLGLKPASVLKVLTALAAFHYLGTEYRFVTDFRLDGRKNLWVKGYGDPMLISEVLRDIALALAEKVRSVGDIVLDDAFFVDPLTIPGVRPSDQPYDAPNGALCANFNTVAFEMKNGRFVSAEPQTPLLPFALEKIRKTGRTRGRIVISRHRKETTRYTGLLLRYYLQKQGVVVNGAVRRTHRSFCEPPPVYRHQSRFTLSEIVEKLMAHSNNFIANQLLIAAGARAFGPPGNLEKGVRAVRSFARVKLGLRKLHLEEGSGISHGNRISALDLIRVLEAFEPYRHLMRHEKRERFKTGRLRGVKTRAGYIRGAAGGVLYRYALLLNSPDRTTAPILKILLQTLP